MVYTNLKIKVARSKEFMSYAHSTKPAPCCICREKPFVQLHHFGSDGGKGLKPSDYQVARLCHGCAIRWELKRNALVKNGYYEVLAAFQQDALELHEGWLRRLEDIRNSQHGLRCVVCKHFVDGQCKAMFSHIEPPGDCAIEELEEALYSGELSEPTEARSWLVGWANRRAANVIEFLVEPLLEIAIKDASEDAFSECRFVAAQALKTAGIEIPNQHKGV